MLIAIDGPAASGKGTLASRVAEHFGITYLDTGSLYRAVGYMLLTSYKNIENAENHSSDEAAYAVSIAEKLDTSKIRKMNISCEGIGKAASIVSAIPDVRKALMKFQKKIASSPDGAVLDGRDIGTIVSPDADYKFFITAKIEARAQRRYKQLQKNDRGIIYEAVLQDLKERDERDGKRKIAPMIPADDAIMIDTTNMAMDEVFNKVIGFIQK